MIKAQLQFIDSAIDVADAFKSFVSTDFEALLHKIIEINIILQKNESITQTEVILKLDLADTVYQRHHVINLINKLSQATHIIVQIEIINPQAHSYHSELQATFDRAYSERLRAWHEQTYHKEQSDTGVAIKDLISAPKSPYLAVSTQEIEELPAAKFKILNRPDRKMFPAPLAETELKTHPLFSSYGGIVEKFEDINPDLLAFGGVYGLINLFSLLKKFPNIELIQSFKDLFLKANPVNIQDLMSPSGRKLLQTCLNWSPEFLSHFLNMTALHNGPQAKSLESFVLKMQSLWETIEDYNVLLPKEIDSYQFDFFQRIDNMQSLVKGVPEMWKKYQIKSIFNLNWGNKAEIDNLLEAYACQWVHPNMFGADEHIRQFYINAARLMKNVAIDTLESYLEYLKKPRASSEKFQLLSWFLSLVPTPNLHELDDIIKWFERQSPESQRAFVDFCHKEGSVFSPSFKDFKDSFSLANTKNFELISLLDYQRLWFKAYPELKDAHWKTLFELLRHHDASIFDILHSTLNTQPSPKLSITYFKTLVTLMFSDASAHMTDLLLAYQDYESGIQDLIISILRSFKLEHGTQASVTALLALLNTDLDDNPAANILQESAWQQAYPGFQISYFANHIDYRKIFDSLESICQRLSVSIKTITDLKVLGFGIKSLLLEPVIDDLNDQQMALNDILSGLQNLKASSTQQIELDGHFTDLQKIEYQFDGFFKRKLGEAFIPLLLSFLPQLDNSLNRDSCIKDLFVAILKNSHKVPSAIGGFFDLEMLKNMQQVDDRESIVAQMMDTQLVTSIRQDMQVHLEKKLICHDSIEQYKLEPLKFLGKMPLNQRGVIDFFNRLQNFTIITAEWPKIESKCQQFQESPLAIWQLCIKYQQAPNVCNYWRGCFDILERLFKHHVKLEKNGPKTLIKLFEIALSQKTNFPNTLGSNGEINHPNWQAFLKFLDKSLSTPDIYQHGHFLCLFPLGIQSTLKTGQEFKFSEMVTMFAQLGEHDGQFLPVLVRSLEDSDEERRQKTQKLIEKLGPIFRESTSRPWLELLRLILTPETLANKLDAILEILDSIQQHPEFDLLSIIINDTTRFNPEFIDQLSHFIHCFKNMSSAWKTTYQKTFCPPLEDPIISKTMPAASSYEPIFSPGNTIWNLWGWLKWPQPLQNHPIVTSSPKTHEKNPEPPNFWPIIARPPFPSIEKLSAWLSETKLERLARQIEAFDTTPTDEPKPVSTPNDLDFSRWIQELECYDGKWSKQQKLNLKSRLIGVCTLARDFCSKSRTKLIQEFNALYPQLRDPKQANLLCLENQLIGLLAAIYQKIDQKMPYPTQVLALLMVLEYGSDHLIAEVDTSEGKATIIALLSILKWARRANNTVLVYTHTRDLATQDFYQKKHHFLFALLNIHAGIIYEHSSPTSLEANGIYYTTQDDMSVFRERHRLTGIHYDFPIDVIVDEVDELILDQSTKINLVKVNLLTKDMDWIYPQINLFIEDHLKNAAIKSTPQSWALKLKETVLAQNQSSFPRIRQLNAIPEEKWLNWIKASVYAQTLIENIDFIVQELDSDDGSLYTTVPYINSSPKNGYQIAYQSYEGIPQLLHAKLESSTRHFIKEDETTIISELPSINFRHVGNLTGFSGSIGGARELLNLQEALLAKSIRIGRYHRKNLDEHPALLLHHQAALHYKILTLLKTHAQPILIVTRKIEDAQQIYDYLKSQQKQKMIMEKQLKLITGQESETSRQQWLYNDSETENFAGKENCVTIATQICGRGTDIRVRHEKGLFVILTDILDARNLCQNKGRAARAGHHGDFISLYNASQLQQLQGSLVLPTLSQETLSCWVQQIQTKMLFANSRERLTYAAEAWCQHHLSYCLDKALTGASSLNIVKAQKKLRQLLEQTWKTHKSIALNIESYKKIATNIWEELLTYLQILGIEPGQTLYSQKDFKIYLSVDDSEKWQTIVKSAGPESFFMDESGRIPTTKPLERKLHPKTEAGFTKDTKKYSELYELLRNQVPLEPKKTQWFDYPSNWFFHILTWFNPSAQKLKLYLNQDWQNFAKNPGFETWSNFYITLLSAESLQNRQAMSRFWRIDYWFNSWNPLGKWCEFKSLAEKSFKQFLFPAKKGVAPDGPTIAKLQSNFQREYSELLSPFALEETGIIFNFMSQLYPETYKILKETNDAWKLFCDKSDNHVNWTSFQEKIKTLNTFYQQYYSFSLWPFSYWNNYFQPWQKLDLDLQKAQGDALELSGDVMEWKTEAQEKSHHRLLYLGHLMCQEQIKTRDIRFNFNLFGSSRFLSQIQQDYDDNNKRKSHDLDLEIGELSRYFPNQLKTVFNQQNPSNPIEMSKDSVQENRQQLCINVLKNYIAPPNGGTSIPIVVQDKQLQILMDELEQWHGRRGLISYLEKV